MKSLVKSTIREIKQSLGRYMAILAIVSLGVGFFGGLKVTKPAMIKTLDTFLSEQNFYDFRLLSTIGFEDEDLDKLSKIPEITEIEASWNVDVLCSVNNGNESAYRVHSITNNINKLLILDGRMPENASECVVDNYMPSVKLGDTVKITDNNDEDTLDRVKVRELKVVGTVRSPYYINFERGNTSIGSGKISGFIYADKDFFDTEYIGEIFVTMSNGEKYGIYTKQYDDYIADKKVVVEDYVTKVVDDRFERIISDANEKIADGEKELGDKKKEAEEELLKAENDIKDAEKKIQDGEIEIADNKKKLEDGQAELDKAKAEVKSNEALLKKSEAELKNQREQLEAGKLFMSELQYNGALMQIEGYEAELKKGRAKINQAKSTIADKEKEIEDGYEKIKDAEKEIEDGKKELDDGKKEYEDGKREFDEKIADAEKEIEDAKKELEDLKEPDSYVLDRNTNIGYACYESDTNIVASVANVFPIFFFLVAVLICMTTMNRMVEEQRTQIGILKALGYSSASILMKYVVYAGSAALIGAISGYILGTVFLPQAIFQGYNIMYNMGSTILYKSVTWVAVSSILAALLCSVGAAYFSVIYELKDVPANLIRPKPPKNGKRIFLEYITVLWKRMPFLHKVSARNIIRYKKRFFMMVIGIGGCTALVLTGFGIGDSIKGVADLQYDTIQIYDMEVVFTDDASRADMDEIKENKSVFLERNMDVSVSGKTKTAYVICPEDPEKIMEFLNLSDYENGNKLIYPSTGEAVITGPLAEKLSAKVGDKLRISDSDMNTIDVVISGICENYVYSYVYISKETYSKITDDIKYNCAWVSKGNKDVHELSKAYMKLDSVMNVNVILDLQERIAVMMGGMDFIVFIVILCAGALAFIVLYNLTNINITERIREIATIKVLGFYASETAQYVFRENMVLTAIGAVVGLPLGKALHTFIMYNIKIDMISFRTYIAGVSYLYAIILTFVFAMIVNGLMYFKLRNINMAESLKSIE